MSKTILLPVDINQKTADLKPLAEALSLLEDGGTLHIVSVAPSFGMAQVSGFFPDKYEKEHLAAFGKQLTAWVTENVPDGVKVKPHVLQGTIYDEILRAANKLNADLIVMGAHRPELSDYLLGPNAARVVRHATQSVYVVRS